MNRKRTTLTARFAPETRFEVPPSAVAPFRAAADNELEQLKQRLLRQALTVTEDAQLYRPLRRAADEAAAVAWLTPFPLLFLPTLFEEKQAAARRQVARQRKVRASTKDLVATVS